LALFKAASNPETSRERAKQSAALGSPNLATLSPQKKEILSLLLAGSTNAQIAETFGISIQTTESYHAEIMKKLYTQYFAQLWQPPPDLGLRRLLLNVRY